MKKPTVEQVAWKVKKIIEGGFEGDTFRAQIYDRMGFGLEAYIALDCAGLMDLQNFIFKHQEDFIKMLENRINLFKKNE
jgi:hypothetical protein